MRLYGASASALRARATATAAESIDLWRHIGLPRPAEEWPQAALALARALVSFIKRPPADESGVAAAWSAVSAGDEVLRDLPLAPIEAFLKRRLFEAKPTEERVQSLRTLRSHYRSRATQRERRAVAVS